MQILIPKPVSLYGRSDAFSIPPVTNINVEPSSTEMHSLGRYLASVLPPAGQVTESGSGTVRLSLNGDASLGEEGYELSITTDAIQLSANRPAGLFYGIQTLRQLIQTDSSGSPRHAQGNAVSLPAVSIRDTPRFAWRGSMLDVARHFFGVEDVKRYIDLISHYKMNRLHLHLSDDQGWRIEIKSWPKLTEVGAQTQVGGGGGGFYTQEQYEEIVDYARSRYVTIVPEIDTPGHTNAALASYPELNSDDKAPALYEGTNVGFSTLSAHKEITYKFLDDVICELAAITPGQYIHIGGDETHSTPKEDYKIFIERMQEIVYAHNKIAIGWAEIGEVELNPKTVAQHWQGAAYKGAKDQGNKFIISPGNKTYLDMKYDETTPIGLNWAGYISVKDSYDWEPGSYMEGLVEEDILGIECPLWTETVLTMKDIEFMAFPRLPGIAELAWSPKGANWEEYKVRLAKHGRYMEAMRINYFKSPDVDWE